MEHAKVESYEDDAEDASLVERLVDDSSNNRSSNHHQTNTSDPQPQQQDTVTARAERSDSFLSTDSTVLVEPSNSMTRSSLNSNTYMEEASMEASLLAPPKSAANVTEEDNLQNSSGSATAEPLDVSESTNASSSSHKIQVRPAGRMGRRRTSVSETEVIPAADSSDNIIDTSLCNDNGTDLIDASMMEDLSMLDTSSSSVAALMDESERGLAVSPPQRSPQRLSIASTTTTSALVMMPPPPPITNGLAKTPSLHELLQREGILKDTSDTKDDAKNEEQEEEDEAKLLARLLEHFCDPPVPLTTIQAVLDMERQQQHQPESNEQKSSTPVSDLEWPDPVTIGVLQHSKVSTLLLHPQQILWQLPLHFSVALLRILIRILLGQEDTRIESCYGDNDSSLPWKQQEHSDQQQPQSEQQAPPVVTPLVLPSPQPGRRRPAAAPPVVATTTTTSVGEDVLASSQVLYHVARWQCTIASMPNNGSSKDKDQPRLLLALLDLLERAPSSPPRAASAASTALSTFRLTTRLARLLGLVAAGGVSPTVLRRMLHLASGGVGGKVVGQQQQQQQQQQQHQPLSSSAMHPTGRLAMVHALETSSAAAATPISHFFVFGGHDNGLRRTLTGLPHWPFRNDFGMACWFRAERFDGSSIVLLSVRSEDGGGIEVSLERISKEAEACTIAVSIYDSGRAGRDRGGAATHHLQVKHCVLLPRVWYHVAVRHTRSRLKGVFSLSMRQQLSILLDGKVMMTESLPFPKVSEADFRDETSLLGSTLRRSISSHTRLNMHLCVGAGLDGETGAIYVFNEAVSVASFQALYEVTGGRKRRAVTRRPSSAADVWDARRSDMVRKSRILDVKMTTDDSEEIVVTHRGGGAGGKKRPRAEKYAVMDVAVEGEQEPEDADLPLDLQKASFASKVFITLDPRRVVGNSALELNAGAHVNLENVYSWSVQGAQYVIGSIGGIQALLPVFRSFLSSEGEHGILLALANTSNKAEDGFLLEDQPVSSVVPALFDMLSSFVKDQSGNSRELLRCGGIDVIADFLAGSKRMLSGKRAKSSMFGAISSCIGLSTRLVESLIRLETSCAPNVALETKVFSRLIFNTPLWLDGKGRVEGDALQSVLFPVLSVLTKTAPERVRDCVGVKDMVHALREVLISFGTGNEKQPTISRETMIAERLEVAEIILGMIFTALAAGTGAEHLSPFLHFISSSIDTGWSDAQSGQRELTVRACIVLVFLLQIRPVVPGLFESFGQSCGNIHSGVGWILCSMVNASDDEIRSLGIRAIASYVEVSSHGPDAAMGLGLTLQPGLDADPHPGSDVASNVMRTSIGRLAKGLAAIGPSTRVISLTSTSKLTPRVVFKLLWHFLKNQRYELSDHTHAALLGLISDDSGILSSSLSDHDFLKEHLLCPSKTKQPGFRLSTSWARATLARKSHIAAKSLRNHLAIGTVLRLLRYLEDKQKDRWLGDLLSLCNSSRKCVSLLASLPDWQPSLFQLLSDTLESVRASNLREHEASPNGVESARTSPEENDGGSEELSHAGSQQKRLNICLDLFSTLLGHLLREGGDKALDAVEMTASLQRTCVNGTDVLLLVLSSFCANIFDHGTILEIGSISAEHWKDVDLEQDSLPLKQSARLVTDAILSQGGEGLDMPTAVRSWRSLRHLTEIIVAVVTKRGLGVVDLFDYRSHQASAVDSVSNGLFGIRLPDGKLTEIKAIDYASFIGITGDQNVNNGDSSVAKEVTRDVDRRICVPLAAQILVLLDAFVFPESIDLSLPASQLHGLALVRNSEARLGSSQGPLVSSAIRLSFVLLALLEPCSVKFLQCASRLRCLLGWALELVRETASEGQPTAFNERTSHIDRLLLAIVLHCHRALGRCSALLTEIESSSHEKYFSSRDAQRKQHRRLLRAALELRDIVSTTFRGRNDVLRATMSTEAYEALRSSLEGQTSTLKSQSKESVVRDFLSSKWVDGFQDIETRFELVIPEQVSMDTIPLDSEDSENAMQGITAIERLSQESSDILLDFERALDGCFKNYLEAQRKWTETDAVRDLEHDGGITLKRLSERQRSDSNDIIRESALRRNRVEHRWNVIEQKTISPWKDQLHWKLPSYTDRLGRRMVLIENREFDNHASASYEIALGLEQEKENAARQSRLLQKEALDDVMRRNAEAFVVHESPEEGEVTDDDSFPQHASDGESSSGVDSLQEKESGDEDTADETVFEIENEDGWDQIDPDEVASVDAEGDGDGWARTFIWSESESVVARFEPVMIVSLQTYVEGKVLLSTHGLYFLQTTGEVSVMTQEVVGVEDSSAFEKRARRWRLSRLTEIHGRRYMLRPQALELFFSNCHELLLNFPSGAKERDRFHAKLRNSCRVPMLWSPKSLNPKTVFRKSNMTELWKKRKISTFEYLMAVNRMAGRSFNDLTQYPVFPWVLVDYTSETIDLNDHRVYRDLSKPVGALNPDRLAQLLERYKDLELFGFTEAEKFLYGSHYSSPGIVLHYLIRQEPFTSMAIDLQSGRFDCPDRLFFDISASWNGCMTSTSDMKELVPEFFYLPEMFQNTNNFPLGRTQTGRLVNNAGLPPWAKGSAHEFVRINRLALESEYVSQNLHHWIDLIFGYKQRGPEAEAAHNIFHHLSYEGSVDVDKITDEVDRKAAESHIQNFGQTPSQLLAVDPHPARYPLGECWHPLIYSPSVAAHLRCHTPSKQFANKRSEFAKGSVMKLFVLPDALLAVYGDMSVGTYRWQPNNRNNRFRMDKLRPLARREFSTSRGAMKRGSAVSAERMDNSRYALGSSSFSITIGGLAKEEQRRKATVPSTLLLPSAESGPVTSEASAMIVSCGYFDDTVKIHAADTVRVLASETGGHRGAVRCLSVGNDGGLMITGGEDGTARVWVVGHHGMAMALADGYMQTALGASTTDGNSEQLVKCCHVLWGHDYPVVCVDLDWELDVAVSGSKSGRICVHTIRRGDFIRSFEPPALSKGDRDGSSVAQLALGTTGVLVAHMEDRGLHCYTANGVRLCSTDAGENLNDMILCSSDQILVTGGSQCRVLIRTVNDLQVCSMLDLTRHGPIRCLSLTPDDLNPVEQFLFVGSDDGMITIVDQDPQSKEKDSETTSF